MSGTLYSIALNVVIALEQLTGMPMVLTEPNTDIVAYRDSAATALCERTGAGFCGEHLDFISNTTTQAGSSTIINYRDNNGTLQSACLILPPANTLTAPDLAYGMSHSYFNTADLPTNEEARSFMLMHWAARCLDQQGSVMEEKRADAFASMAIALAQGDPAFTRYPLETPARKFAFIRNRDTSEAAVDHAERWMLEIWKPEAAQALRAQQCQASAVPSREERVSHIRRDSTLPACFQHHREQQIPGNFYVPGSGGWASSYYALGPVSVTDANLHLWMYGESRNEVNRKRQQGQPENPAVGAPPRPWTPFKGFSSTREAVQFMWTTVSSITGLPT